MIAFRHLNGGLESEPLVPELEAWFYSFDGV